MVEVSGEVAPVRLPPMAEDHAGERFGETAAVYYAGTSKWLCKCDCGNEHTALAHNLKSGKTKSCGCRRARLVRDRNLERGDGLGLELRVWLADGMSSGPCTDCAMWPEDPVQMDFDHVFGDKVDSVSATVRRNGLVAMLDEVSKCELVCANCHRLRTKVRRVWTQSA